MEQPVLRRTLGLFDVALFFIVAGSNLQWVATAAAAGPSSIAVWFIVCGAMFVPLSVVVMYLTTAYPDEGGMYVWAKHAFGPLAGFFTGWTYWTSNLPYFPTLLYFAAGNVLFVSASGHAALGGSAPYFIAVALAGLALSTILNILGLDVGKWLNNVGAVTRWVVTLALIALGAFAWMKFGPATQVNAATIRPALRLQDLIFWSTIAFAWTGPEAISFMAGEIRNPRRSIPIGLAIAAPAIGAIYIIGTLAVLAALPASKVDPSSGVMQAIASVAGRVQLNAIVPVMAIFVAVSCLGSCGAWLGAVARIPFVAGIDRYLPDTFGRMHPRWGSPVAALLTQAGIAAVFIFLGQAGSSVATAYNDMVNATVLITMLPFLLLFASAVKLCLQPRNPEAMRIPGGRVTVTICAIVGFATTTGAAVLSVIPPDDEANKVLHVLRILGMTLLLVAAGAAVYLLGRRRAASFNSSHQAGA